MHERLQVEAEDCDVSMAQVCREAVRDKIFRDTEGGPGLSGAVNRAIHATEDAHWEELGLGQSLNSEPETEGAAPETTDWEVSAEVVYEIEEDVLRPQFATSEPGPAVPWYERYSEEIKRFHKPGPRSSEVPKLRSPVDGSRDPREQWD